MFKNLQDISRLKGTLKDQIDGLNAFLDRYAEQSTQKKSDLPDSAIIKQTFRGSSTDSKSDNANSSLITSF